jgi:peptidoglycan/LPS O-acetylase OafA/YrhL
MAHAFYAETDTVRQSVFYKSMIYFQQVFSFGVPIFFVLSGFLISYLMFKEEHMTGFNLKNFYIRRFLRIWPVYYLTLFVGFIAFPLIRTYVLNSPGVETANVFMYMTFLSNFDQINQPSLPFGIGLGPTWSVSIEEQFYLLWPLLFLIFKREKFIVPILLIVLAAILSRVFLHVNHKHTLYCMMYLGVGAAYGYLCFYHEEMVKKITKIPSLVFFGLLVLILILMCVNVHVNSHFAFVVIIALLLGYVIVHQSFTEKLEFRSIPYIESLGRYTYGLYLYHVICNFVTYTIVFRILHLYESTWLNLVVVPIISLLLSILVSVISYKYFESFFLNWNKKFAGVL